MPCRNKDDYRHYFELLSRTVEDLNSFPPDGDIYAYIATILQQIAPDDTVILVNSFDPDTRTMTLHAVEGLGGQQSDVEAVLGRPLKGMEFSLPDPILPFMLTGECNEIPGRLAELTFGCLPNDICEKIETMPFFGIIYSAGISWKGKLKGATAFILPQGKELENRDLITFFIRQVAGFLSRRAAEALLQDHVADLRAKELALRQSEETYRTLAESAQEIIFIINRVGKITYVNSAMETFFGIRPQNAVGQDLNKIFPHPVTAQQGPSLQQVFTTGKPVMIEMDIPLQHGQVWFNTRLVPLFDSDHKVDQVMGIARDITDRKQAEEALATSEERYRSFVQRFQGIAYLSTSNWIPIFFHGAVEEITGYTEQEFIRGNPRWNQVIYPEDLEEIDRKDTENLLTVPGFSIVREYRIIQKDGQMRWISDFIQNQTNDKGELLLSGIMTDITGRKDIEEELRQKTAEIEGFFSVALDMLSIANTDGYFLLLNPAWERVLGYSRKELMAKSFLEFVHPDDLKLTMDAISALVNQKYVINFVNRYRCRDGTYRWIEWQSAPAGNLIYAAARDITERKRAEEALFLANKKLNLLSGITRHDIRNQLLALEGYLEISKDYLNDPARTSGFIEKEQKIVDTIGHQIIFSRDYEDMGVKAPSWQNVSAVITKVIARLPMRNIRVDAGDPRLEIFADPLVEKVFYNLFDNALQYGGEKMTGIRVTNHNDNGNLALVLEDDGNGISVADKKQLFTKGFGKHTGLGLFLSREILSITGISITENGEPGAGARFEMTVPNGGYHITGS